MNQVLLRVKHYRLTVDYSWNNFERKIMTKIIPFKSRQKVKIVKTATALPQRLCSEIKCSAYEHPSDEYHLDYILQGKIAKLTGGISPIALGLAGYDWLSHLMFSPTKQKMLRDSLTEKTSQFKKYALKASSGEPIDRIVTPSPADKRFISENWQHWPFNIMEQGFLLNQEWWSEATSGVRGVADHHLNVISYTARQLLDIASPSNSPFTNPELYKQHIIRAEKILQLVSQIF
jgi:hypothetical protein